MLRASRVPSGALALLLAISSASPALAQRRHHEPSPADIAAARDLGTQGVLLAQAGDCKAAIEKLTRAAALFAAPTIVEQLGECQVKTGRLVAGTENLQSVAREKFADDAPKPFVEAQQKAQALLESALPRIAHLVIVIDAPAGAKPSVTVDGAKVPLALLGAERPTDPGTREVMVRAPGFLPARRRVTLDEGGSARVRLELKRDPNAPTASDQGGATTPPKRTLSYVLFGVGGAAVVTGSVLGLMAASKKSDLEHNCPGARCSRAYAGELDTARALGTGSTIAFGVGVAAVAAATYLFVTSEPTSETPPDKHASGPHVWVGLGSAGIAGKF